MVQEKGIVTCLCTLCIFIAGLMFLEQVLECLHQFDPEGKGGVLFTPTVRYTVASVCLAITHEVPTVVVRDRHSVGCQ